MTTERFEKLQAYLGFSGPKHAFADLRPAPSSVQFYVNDPFHLLGNVGQRTYWQLDS